MVQFNPARVLLLDFLRVVAISMVLFSHVSITVGPPWNQLNQFFVGVRGFFYWTTWGEIGVTIFLIISGLSLEYTYGEKEYSFTSFYIRRIIRIYPIYYLSLLLGLGVHIAFGLWGNLHYGEPFIVLPGFGFDDLLLALSGLNAFAGKWGGPLVWTSWFIGLVMVSYIFYPGISYGVKKYPWGTLFFLFFISLASRFVIERSNILSGNPKEWFPLNRIFEFGLGIYLVKVLKKDFLLRFNKILRHFPFLSFFSAISFPLFLMHDPLRRLIVFGPRNTISLMTGISIFLLLSIIISKITLFMDRKIQTSLKSRFHLATVS
ncbi:MAG: acyltransferase family protein [Proteobacteria bacterium]|nr:acyltransferase family protein [Pseudomonadota bacterium]